MKRTFALLTVTAAIVLSYPSHSSAQPAGTEIPEIVVTADAVAVSSIDRVKITVAVEASAPSGSAAIDQLQSKAAKVAEPVLALSKTISKAECGQELTNESQRGAAITANTPVRAKKYLLFETTEPQRAGAMVDTALRAGATSVTEVEFVSENDGEAKLRALQEATRKAKVKAELLAGLLGVKVGPIIAVSEGEEPAGAQIRKQMIRGGNLEHFGEQEANVVVNVRFEAIRQ